MEKFQLSRVISIFLQVSKLVSRFFCIYAWTTPGLPLYCLVFLQVSLLGRLHHRNLVNLIGYCVDKGKYMLIYEFMSNGSLSNLIYSKLKGLHFMFYENFFPCDNCILEYLIRKIFPHKNHWMAELCWIVAYHLLKLLLKTSCCSCIQVKNGFWIGKKGFK